MGTVIEITAHGPDPERLQGALTAALDEVSRLDDLLSTWKPDSAVSRLNTAAGGPQSPCAPPLAELVRLSLHYAKVTDGAFSPALHPLIRAWGLEGAPRTPPPEALVAALELSRTELVTAGVGTIGLRRAGAGLNFGAIGKGYALDRAAALLEAHGVRSALLNFGGQVLALEPPPGATAWTVEIADPLDPAARLGALPLVRASASTSAPRAGGDGRPHVLDPATGRFVVRDAQVTVVAPNATEADALSTAMLVLGRDRAGALAARLPRVRVLWADLPPDGAPARLDALGAATSR